MKIWWDSSMDRVKIWLRIYMYINGSCVNYQNIVALGYNERNFYLVYTMNKSSQMQPVFIRIILSNSFSWLQQVLNLWFIQIRIAVIHDLIEKFAALPYAHLHSVQFGVLFPHLLHLHYFSLEVHKYQTMDRAKNSLVKKLFATMFSKFAYKVIGLVNVLLPIEFLHALLPFTFCIVVPAKCKSFQLFLSSHLRFSLNGN